jgi:hypothetical protein
MQDDKVVFELTLGPLKYSQGLKRWHVTTHNVINQELHMHSLFPRPSGQASHLVVAPHPIPLAMSYSGNPQIPIKSLATPYERGGRYEMRTRYKGRSIYVSGYDSASSANEAMRNMRTAVDQQRFFAGNGPDRTTVARALQDYAMARLPFLKNAEQEAARINRYLRYAGLDTLFLTRHETSTPKTTKNKNNEKNLVFFVTLKPHSSAKKAGGLGGHSKAHTGANIAAEMHRAVLARTIMSRVQPIDIQHLMDAMHSDGKAPSTMALERRMLRALFNYADWTWGWANVGCQLGCIFRNAESVELQNTGNAFR